MVKKLLEVVVPILVLSVLGTTCILSCVCGNQYFTRDGVDREVRKFDPSIVVIQEVHRSVFDGTDMQVKHQDGRVTRLCLDSDITFAYAFYLPKNGISCGLPPPKPTSFDPCISI